jgi:hypothetical protein
LATWRKTPIRGDLSPAVRVAIYQFAALPDLLGRILATWSPVPVMPRRSREKRGGPVSGSVARPSTVARMVGEAGSGPASVDVTAGTLV